MIMVDLAELPAKRQRRVNPRAGLVIAEPHAVLDAVAQRDVGRLDERPRPGLQRFRNPCRETSVQRDAIVCRKTATTVNGRTMCDGLAVG